MAIPDRAPESTVHNGSPAGETQRADVTRAHARDSVTDAPDDVLSLTERNRLRLQERWGQPIEEPPDDIPEDAGDAFGWRAVIRGATVHLHVYRDPIPSIRAVRADYRKGLADAQQQSASAVAIYRIFGLPGQAWAATFRLLAVQGDRAGRFAGFLIILVFVAGALAWAGLL